MTIKIKNAKDLFCSLIKDELRESYVISIRDNSPKDETKDIYEKINNLIMRCQGIYIIHFDDVIDEKLCINTAPKKFQVLNLLKWAENKENITVHCTAGISRSSAIAYSIMCNRVIPSEAIKILDINRHYPNKIIVKYASEILRNPDILKEYEEFVKKLQ